MRNNNIYSNLTSNFKYIFYWFSSTFNYVSHAIWEMKIKWNTVNTSGNHNEDNYCHAKLPAKKKFYEHQNATSRSRRMRNANDGQLVDKWWRPHTHYSHRFLWIMAFAFRHRHNLQIIIRIMRCGEWKRPFQLHVSPRRRYVRMGGWGHASKPTRKVLSKYSKCPIHSHS